MSRARAFSIMAGDRSTPSSRAASGLNAMPASPVPQPRSRMARRLASRHHQIGQVPQNLRRGIGQLPDHARVIIGGELIEEMAHIAGIGTRRRPRWPRRGRSAPRARATVRAVSKISSALSASPASSQARPVRKRAASRLGIEPQRPLQFRDRGGKAPAASKASPKASAASAMPGLSEAASRASASAPCRVAGRPATPSPG